MSNVDIYNEDYAKKYAALAATPLGQAIYGGRWALITRHVKSPFLDKTWSKNETGAYSLVDQERKPVLLDYGSGPGSFNAHGPNSFEKYNYDVNPSCGFSEIPTKHIDVLCMWDSIEHIPNFFGKIQEFQSEWLFITTPNLEAFTKPAILEKHYRPREHLFYFDRHSLSVILEELGYQVVEINFDEGKLRDPLRPEAIITLVARKYESN